MAGIIGAFNSDGMRDIRASRYRTPSLHRSNTERSHREGDRRAYSRSFANDMEALRIMDPGAWLATMKLSLPRVGQPLNKTVTYTELYSKRINANSRFYQRRHADTTPTHFVPRRQRPELRIPRRGPDGPEIKSVDTAFTAEYHDYGNASTTYGQTFPVAFNRTRPLVIGINLVRDGTAFFERVGTSLCARSLRLSGRFSFVSTGQTDPFSAFYSQPFVVRVSLVYDTRPQYYPPATVGLVAPTVPDIFLDQFQLPVDYPAGITNLQQNVLAGPNLRNRDRFKIIRDLFFSFPEAFDPTDPDEHVPVLSSNAPPDARFYRTTESVFNASCKGLCTTFGTDPTTTIPEQPYSTIPNITSGAFYVVFQTSFLQGGTYSQANQGTFVPYIGFEGKIRYRYTDA